jgi:hypothetical protein
MVLVGWALQISDSVKAHRLRCRPDLSTISSSNHNKDTDQGCLRKGLFRPSHSPLNHIRQMPHSHFALSVIAGGLKSIRSIVNRPALEDMLRATEHHKAREAIVFYGIHLAW